MQSTTIHHDIRAKWRLTPNEYVILDCLGIVKEIPEFLNIPPLEYELTIKKLTDMGLVDVDKASKTWRPADISQEILDYFNKVNGTNFRSGQHLIQILIRQRYTFDHFASVILHKKETWGEDEDMRQWIRPATLFRSKNKFATYLDDATNYWIQKTKK